MHAGWFGFAAACFVAGVGVLLNGSFDGWLPAASTYGDTNTAAVDAYVREQLQRLSKRDGLMAQFKTQFVTRADDVILATYPKSGTTWLQTICIHLVTGSLEKPQLDFDSPQSPFLERILMNSGLNATLEFLEGMTNRRLLKTHEDLAKDFPAPAAQTTTIVVARNPKDTIVSLWHHARNVFRDPRTFEQFCDDLLSRERYVDPNDWFEWTQHGFAVYQVVGSSRVLWLYYEDMIREPLKAVRAIARHLDVQVEEAFLEEVVAKTSFKSMKKELSANCENCDTRIRKGGVGGWRDYLTADQSEAVDAKLLESIPENALNFVYGLDTETADASRALPTRPSLPTHDGTSARSVVWLNFPTTYTAVSYYAMQLFDSSRALVYTLVSASNMELGGSYPIDILREPTGDADKCVRTLFCFGLFRQSTTKLLEPTWAYSLLVHNPAMSLIASYVGWRFHVNDKPFRSAAPATPTAKPAAGGGQSGASGGGFAMRSWFEWTLPGLQAHDWSPYSRVIDVGGGLGSVLNEILTSQCSTCHGVLFDRADIVRKAETAWNAENVSAAVLTRTTFMPGDMTQHLPPALTDVNGKSAYVFRNIFHDWTDKDTVQIMRNVRQTIGESGSKLVIIERCWHNYNIETARADFTMRQRAHLNGQERSTAQFDALLRQAGMQVENSTWSGYLFTIVVAGTIPGHASTSADSVDTIDTPSPPPPSCPILRYPRTIPDMLTSEEAEYITKLWYEGPLKSNFTSHTYFRLWRYIAASRDEKAIKIIASLRKQIKSNFGDDMIILGDFFSDNNYEWSQKKRCFSGRAAFEPPRYCHHRDGSFWLTEGCDNFNIWLLLDHNEYDDSFGVFPIETNPTMYQGFDPCDIKKETHSCDDSLFWLDYLDSPTRKESDDHLKTWKIKRGEALVVRHYEVHGSDFGADEPHKFRLALGLKIIRSGRITNKGLTDNPMDNNTVIARDWMFPHLNENPDLPISLSQGDLYDQDPYQALTEYWRKHDSGTNQMDPITLERDSCNVQVTLKCEALPFPLLR